MSVTIKSKSSKREFTDVAFQQIGQYAEALCDYKTVVSVKTDTRLLQ